MRRATACSTTLLIGLLLSAGCRDLSRFTSGDDHFEGPVVRGSFVRAGVDENARLCLTLDTDHLQDAPGTLSTTDGRFHATPLRPIPQVWHDPLSTMSFGEGRIKNLLYAATPSPDAGDPQDLFVIVSLLQSNDVEVRLLRSAPGGSTNAVFGVFTLERQPGPCSF
jgi:hypothetical protein